MLEILYGPGGCASQPRGHPPPRAEAAQIFATTLRGIKTDRQRTPYTLRQDRGVRGEGV